MLSLFGNYQAKGAWIHYFILKSPYAIPNIKNMVIVIPIAIAEALMLTSPCCVR